MEKRETGMGERKTKFEKIGLGLIVSCFLSILLSWNLCSVIASKICGENIVTIKMVDNTGEKANIWLNWYPGLKIIENKGFVELEDRHYVSSENNSILSFYSDNIANGNIMCIFEGGGDADLSVKSGLNSQCVQWESNEAGNSVVVVQQKEYLPFVKTSLTVLFVFMFGGILFFVAKLFLRDAKIREFMSKKSNLVLALFLIWGIGVFGGMLQTTLSVDDYAYYLVYSNGYRFDIDDYSFVLYQTGIKEGRIVNGILYVIFDFLCSGFFLLYQPLTLFLCIILLAVVAKVIYEIFTQAFEIEPQLNCKNLIAFIGAGLFVFNPFTVETLCFHKVNLIFLIGALCAVWAARLYLGDGKRKILWTEVLLFLSVFIYQPYGAWFVMLCSMAFLGEYLKQRQGGIQRWFSNTFKMLMMYAIPIFVNLVFMVIFGSTSRMSVSGVGEKLIKFFEQIQLVILNGHGRMNSPYFLIYFLLIILVIILLGKTEKLKKDFYSVLFMTVIILVGIVFYFQLATNLWSIDERTCSMIMGIPGFLTVVALGILYTEKNINKKRIEQFLLILISVLGIVYARDIQIDVGKVVSTNIADAEVCRIYQSEIEEYEVENHVEIEKIAFINMYNSYSSVYNKGIDNSTELYWSAFHVDWSKLELLNLISGRDYVLYKYDDNDLRENASILYENGIVHFKNNIAFIEIY